MARIEEQVLAFPKLKNTNETEMFKRYFKQIVPKLSLPNTSYEILKAFSNIDVTAEKVAFFLKNNPYYEYQVLKFIESKNVREVLPNLESIVIMIGMQNTRDLILSLQLLRLVRENHPLWDKDGKLAIVPSDVIKYALKTEALLAGDRSGYSDMGYAAGLLYDLLVLIGTDLSKDKNKFLAYIEAVYNQGLKTAQIAVTLAKNVPDMAFSKYLFGASLVHDVGKVVIAILSSEYIAFEDQANKKMLTRMVRYYAEERKFGVNHAMIGGLTCQYFRIFKTIEKAILYHHEPFLLRKWKPNLFQLSSVVSLASNIANGLRRVDGPNDPILKTWKGPELNDFKMEFKQLSSVINRMIADGGAK